MTRAIREVEAARAVAYVKARTPAGERWHAVATDDPRFAQHAAGTWGTARCGVLAKRTHHAFRPDRPGACATCAAVASHAARVEWAQDERGEEHVRFYCADCGAESDDFDSVEAAARAADEHARTGGST